MHSTKTFAAVVTSVAAAFALQTAWAEDPATTTTTDAPGLTRAEAKDLKTESKAQYKANKKVIEAQEEVNKADCKTTFDGNVKRSCVKSAKAAAKSDTHAAKGAQQLQEKAIDEARKQ